MWSATPRDCGGSGVLHPSARSALSTSLQYMTMVINPPERKTYLGDNASVATAAGILVERQRFQRVAVLPNVILGFVVPF